MDRQRPAAPADQPEALPAARGPAGLGGKQVTDAHADSNANVNADSDADANSNANANTDTDWTRRETGN